MAFFESRLRVYRRWTLSKYLASSRVETVSVTLQACYSFSLDVASIREPLYSEEIGKNVRTLLALYCPCTLRSPLKARKTPYPPLYVLRFDHDKSADVYPCQPS